MNFDAIFAAYYNLYRATATIPATTDAEYTIGLRLANEALSRWANYDNTFWNTLYTTPQAEGDTSTIVTDQTQYDVPDNFVAPGGLVTALDSNGNTQQRYPLIEPNQTQFKGDQSKYAYFMGNPSDGFTLNLNPAPDAALNGMELKYVYYKSPTTYASGTDVSEIPNPYFIVHRMLANRFRASRNPYYTDALRDAEDALQIMKMENDSGTWSNPLTVSDTSGTQWGN